MSFFVWGGSVAFWGVSCLKDIVRSVLLRFRVRGFMKLRGRKSSW